MQKGDLVAIITTNLSPSLKPYQQTVQKVESISDEGIMLEGSIMRSWLWFEYELQLIKER